ncbi:transporter permease [Natronococcus wangiae]|uniref:hypothetical protein n=1 Tax=Natronococcus wangiae TaxID=3068275 RepID=UPI00273CFEC5|nr:hypothetical protein [Natronococcus sp. AD5]
MVVLGLVYLFAALLTELLSNNANIVLMISITSDVAVQLGADLYTFVLAVVFASSTPLLSPVGYQTNLMGLDPAATSSPTSDVATLQVLLAVVAILSITVIWDA